MANRWWVGGTGSWTSSNTTNWSSVGTGGAGGASVPGSGDAVIFDGASGGGTVTLNFGGTITVQTISLGAFTGTFDNSVNNNNITLSAAAGFVGSGSGARTVKLGTATYTLTANNAAWNWATTTNLTYTGNTGASIVFTGASSGRTFSGGGLSHGNVTFGASSGSGAYTLSGANTLASLTITAPNYVLFPGSTTNTITAAFNWAGSSSSQIGIASTTAASPATIAAAASSVAQYCSFRDATFTGSPIATNSFDVGGNSGITITAPSGASGASRARVFAGM